MFRLLVFRALVVCLSLTFFHNAASGKEIVALRIIPENVGVFYQNETQQFQAIAVFDDGSEEDFTTKVGWSIEGNPFEGQDLKPHEVATIDENGLVTVQSTWGRVNVTATYPPPAKFSANLFATLLLSKPPEPVKKAKPLMPGVLGLLLLNNSSKTVVSVENISLAGLNSELLEESGEFILQKGNLQYLTLESNPWTILPIAGNIFQYNVFMKSYIPMVLGNQDSGGTKERSNYVYK